MNNVAVTESFCYNEDDQETSNLAVSGAEPLSRSAAFVTGQRLTSVAVDLIAGSTVAFFGTHSGHLIKVSKCDISGASELNFKLFCQLKTFLLRLISKFDWDLQKGKAPF